MDGHIPHSVHQLRPSNTANTRSTSGTWPTVEIALVSPASIQDIIEGLCCPLCNDGNIRCIDWKNLAGGFTFKLKCQSSLCFFQKTCSSSPKMSNNKH